MKKTQTILLFLFFLCLPINATNTPCMQTSTTYNKDEKIFKTVSNMSIKSSISSTNMVLKKFVYDLTNDPESLFDNLLLGLGKQGNEKDIFLIDYKSCIYDSKRDVYIGTLDVLFNGMRVSNISFEGKITKKISSNQSSEYNFELLTSNILLSYASGKIIANKKGNETVEVISVAKFKFNWFFNFFFSLQNYKNIAEWRVEKFMENMNREILAQENK